MNTYEKGVEDDVPAIEVELEDGPGPDVDLYFTPDGTFLFAAVEVDESALPAAIIMVIETDYADYEIDDVGRFELADGSLQYEVKLEPDSGSDLEIVFNEDGSIYCLDD